MTAEIQFEQQFEDVTRTRAALQRCERQLGQIPKVLKELCTLFKECSISLDQVVTSSAVDATVADNWNRAKTRYLAFADGDALATFTTYFQREVVNRLGVLAARTESAYVAGKDRREAREKFLKNTNRKVDPGKAQKKKDVFFHTDQDFGSLYNQLNSSRANVAGPVARSFFLGYASVTFAIANALCVTDEVITADTLYQESRRAARVQRVTAIEERGYRPGGGGTAATPASPGTITTPTKPAAAASPTAPHRQQQRRLSDLGSTTSLGTGGGEATGTGTRHARPATPVIPIYYNDPLNGNVGSVAEAVPGIESTAPNSTDSSPEARPSLAGADGDQRGSGNMVARARRSTAPTVAHFHGLGDDDGHSVERTGDPPGRPPSEQKPKDDDQYGGFFDAFLRGD